MPMGPFRLSDLVGEDIGLFVAQSYLKDYAERVYRGQLIPLMNEAKRLGEKTGGGFYRRVGEIEAVEERRCGRGGERLEEVGGEGWRGGPRQRVHVERLCASEPSVARVRRDSFSPKFCGRCLDDDDINATLTPRPASHRSFEGGRGKAKPAGKEIAGIVEKSRKAAGLMGRAASAIRGAQDIVEFIFFPVVNEGCRVIAEVRQKRGDVQGAGDLPFLIFSTPAAAGTAALKPVEKPRSNVRVSTLKKGAARHGDGLTSPLHSRCRAWWTSRAISMSPPSWAWGFRPTGGVSCTGQIMLVPRESTAGWKR